MSERPPLRALQLGVRRVELLRVRGGESREDSDEVACEEPLEIRIQGEAFATTMRTPGNDPELAAGLLFAEGVISSRADLATLAHCGRPDEEAYGNVLEVTPAAGALCEAAFERGRRGTLTTSACGVCGRRSIADLLAWLGPLDDETIFDRAWLASLPDELLVRQANFARTGGLHAAGIARSGSHFDVVREDVGRHNAVDKVIGRLLLDGALPARGSALVVSGRSSFEIVQKALRAGIAAVISVSAPSSLAINTAQRFGALLAGFARKEAFNVYAGAARLAETPQR